MEGVDWEEYTRADRADHGFNLEMEMEEVEVEEETPIEPPVSWWIYSLLLVTPNIFVDQQLRLLCLDDSTQDSQLRISSGSHCISETLQQGQSQS